MIQEVKSSKTMKREQAMLIIIVPRRVSKKCGCVEVVGDIGMLEDGEDGKGLIRVVDMVVTAELFEGSRVIVVASGNMT